MIYNLNLFYVSDISAAGEIRGYPLKQSIELPEKLDYEYFNDTIDKGQIILVAFKFDCNLDYSLKNCKPEISFQRIDNAVFSSGFVYYIFNYKQNFRYTNRYYENGVEYRDLWKIFGIKIIVTIEGTGRMYNNK